MEFIFNDLNIDVIIDKLITINQPLYKSMIYKERQFLIIVA